jgi:hypothetical protein
MILYINTHTHTHTHTHTKGTKGNLRRWERKREWWRVNKIKFTASVIKMSEKTHWKLLDNTVGVDGEGDNNRGKKLIKIKA